MPKFWGKGRWKEWLCKIPNTCLTGVGVNYRMGARKEASWRQKPPWQESTEELSELILSIKRPKFIHWRRSADRRFTLRPSILSAHVSGRAMLLTFLTHNNGFYIGIMMLWKQI